MELKIENAAMIAEANVKIDGLTIIAGENDTGKSTIGKVLFCAIKSSAMSDGRFFYNNRNKYILNKLFNNLKNLISMSSTNANEYEHLANKVNNIKNEVEKILIGKTKDTKKRYLETIKKLKEDEEISKIALFDKIYEALTEAIKDDFKNKFTANNFSTIMGYAFSNDFYSHFQTEKEEKKLKATIEDKIKNRKIRFALSPENNFFAGSKIFDDALYIDTPVIFQLIKLLNDTALADKEYMPTIKDLKQKLLNLPQKIEIWEQSNIQKIAEYIQEIIQGDISNTGTEILYSKKGDQYNIKIENTATGIKNFGLILLLLKQGYIHEKMILILDEPEVHLHPKWQLKMAEIIIMLVKMGVTVLVSSHSPYMIEALKRISEKERIEEKTNFYLAENGEINHQESLEKKFLPDCF